VGLRIEEAEIRNTSAKECIINHARNGQEGSGYRTGKKGGRFQEIQGNTIHNQGHLSRGKAIGPEA